ncbi:hypothetical protein QS257_01645 [Terrilactibacillus sp. S3-3]|nr:hypothetical protein QS257_01645 [Terrilactibacillus sp. S3-3]
MKKIFVFPLIFLLAIIISACSEDVNVGNDGSAKPSSASESKIHTAKKEPIHKQVKLNFMNTSAQQTTPRRSKTFPT